MVIHWGCPSLHPHSLVTGSGSEKKINIEPCQTNLKTTKTIYNWALHTWFNTLHYVLRLNPWFRFFFSVVCIWLGTFHIHVNVLLNGPLVVNISFNYKILTEQPLTKHFHTNGFIISWSTKTSCTHRQPLQKWQKQYLIFIWMNMEQECTSGLFNAVVDQNLVAWPHTTNEISLEKTL